MYDSILDFVCSFVFNILKYINKRTSFVNRFLVFIYKTCDKEKITSNSNFKRIEIKFIKINFKISRFVGEHHREIWIFFVFAYIFSNSLFQFLTAIHQDSVWAVWESMEINLIDITGEKFPLRSIEPRFTACDAKGGDPASIYGHTSKINPDNVNNGYKGTKMLKFEVKAIKKTNFYDSFWDILNKNSKVKVKLNSGFNQDSIIINNFNKKNIESNAI